MSAAGAQSRVMLQAPPDAGSARAIATSAMTIDTATAEISRLELADKARTAACRKNMHSSHSLERSGSSAAIVPVSAPSAAPTGGSTRAPASPAARRSAARSLLTGGLVFSPQQEGRCQQRDVDR